jgi:hypothetical protein
MYLDWTTLLLLCLAAGIAWFWQDSLAAREMANAAAMEACEQLSLQFLDGTVAFARLRLGRATSGRLILRRTYVFDYTANSIERRQGFIVVSAKRVETVGYAQDESNHRPPSAVQPSPPATPTAESGQVIRLSQWRARSDRPPESGDPDADRRSHEQFD